MGVSENSGFSPKSSISIGFSIINHSILGVLPLFETPTCIYHNRWLQKVASCTVVVTLSGTWHIIPLRRTPRNCRFTERRHRILLTVTDEGATARGEKASFFRWPKGGGNHNSDQNPGWLFCIEDYTTQLYGDYTKPL